MSLAAGAVVARSRSGGWKPAARILVLLALIGQTGWMMRTTFQTASSGLLRRRGLEGELRELEQLVASAPGPVLADEYLGLSSLQGRRIEFQPFEFTQLARQGRWDQSPILERLRARHYSYVILYRRPWVVERWTPEMLAEIARSYEPMTILAENEVYRPRGRLRGR